MSSMAMPEERWALGRSMVQVVDSMTRCRERVAEARVGRVGSAKSSGAVAREILEGDMDRGCGLWWCGELVN